MRQPKYKYTEEEFKTAVKDNFSVATVLKALKIAPAGGNYNGFYTNVKKFGVDISHFLGKGHLKDKTHNWSRKFSLEEIMIENSFYTSTRTLKERLLKDNVLECKCVECGVTDTYNNKPIVLHLDHVNGISNDHRLENLRLLCPNCHSQTDTYTGKNIGKRPDRPIAVRPIKQESPTSINEKETPESNTCLDCPKAIMKKSLRCITCEYNTRKIKHKVHETKIVWPEKEKLLEMVWEQSSIKLSKVLGISDKAIEKHCTKLGIAKPPRGYWARSKQDQEIIKNKLLSI